MTTDLSDTPIGCGPEGAVSQYDELLNSLETMAGSYGYAARKGVLREAARTIMKLERELAETVRVDGQRLALFQVALDNWRAFAQSLTGVDANDHGWLRAELESQWRSLRAVIEDECQWLAERREEAVAADYNLLACRYDERRSLLAAALGPSPVQGSGSDA